MSLFDVEPVDPRLEAETTRVRSTVAYDGAGFHGFWPNDGVPTVGGTLIAAIEQVLTHTIEMTCAGRTDTGVHAWGQVVTFDAFTETLDLERLQTSVNKLCGPAIVVREAVEVPPDFDARGSATARTYRYTVLNRAFPDPFLHATTWHVPAPLDLRALTLACDPLIGSHDFSSFLSPPEGARGPGPGVAHPAGDRRPLGRAGGRRAPLRDHRQRVLSPDGALDRRSARRRRQGPLEGG